MPASAAVQRKAIGLVVVAVLALLGARMRLRLLPAGDEGRQPLDVAFAGCIARLRARLVRLRLLVLGERLRVARYIGLRLARTIGRPRPRRPSTAGRRRRRRRRRSRRRGRRRGPRCPDGRTEDCSVGTAPARRRSDGNNARRAGSNSPPRSDPRRFARRGRAAYIFPRCGMGFREFSHPGRSTRRRAPSDCGSCGVIAPAHALVLTVSHGSPVVSPFIVAA